MSHRYPEFDPDRPFRDDDDDPFFRRDRGSGTPRVVSDFVRKAIENTVGSMQNTGSVSKEALQFLLQQGDKGKREMVRIVAKEVGDFMRGLDLSSEMIKVLTALEVEVKASVRFKPSGEGIKPEIKAEADVTYPPDAVDPLEDLYAEAERRFSGEAPPAPPARPGGAASGPGSTSEP